MIELGERKGTKDEKHFVLTVDASVKGLPVLTHEFDIYADSEQAAWLLLKEYIYDDLKDYGFTMIERRKVSS